MDGGRRRTVVTAAAGLIPVAIAAAGARWLTHRAATAIARGVVAVGDEFAERTRVVAAQPLPRSPEARAIEALDGRPASGPRVEPASAMPRSTAPTASPSPSCDDPTEACGFPKPVGVFVSRARVLAAAQAGIRPSGTPVPATGWRPAGVALHGVSGLGVGLREGDVLIAPSEGAVVGQVIAALRRRAPAMSGVAWRGRQRIHITVELPDLAKVDTPSDERQTPQP
ncbi:MAG: hypothetical protein FJ096_02845 [Deltaproteobacteria bacterium]|nr:hypothetical protein [Deltaproteobacteria bacterium]